LLFSCSVSREPSSTSFIPAASKAKSSELSLLLQGFLPAQAVSVITDQAPVRVAAILFEAAFFFFNLAWYWAIGYGVVRIARRWKPWDGF